MVTVPIFPRPQEARLEAASVLTVGGTKEQPASYIEGGIYFFVNNATTQATSSHYQFLLDAAAQGLLSKSAIQGNEYFYAVGPTWWTRAYLKAAYVADPNDLLFP